MTRLAESALVRDVMRTPVMKALPTTSASEVAKLMIDNKVGSIVIVDEQDNLVGIVTKSDIVREVVVRGLPRNIPVSEIMAKNPFYVMEDSTVHEAAEIMGTHGVGHLPVLSRQNLKPIGMISKRDITRLAPHLLELVYMLKAQKP
ncbi:MAG: cyclic nucleotide-binding/CBS domain-containing protein [Acidilobus sp.]